MKKSFSKKLALNKKTIVNLQIDELQNVVGGKYDTLAYPNGNCISSSFIACISACVTACPTESAVICCEVLD